MTVKAWLLTEGAAGMISQAQGLAESLGLTFEKHSIETKPPWRYLPAKLTPPYLWALQNTESTRLPPAPIIISCGRKSVAPALILKKYHPQTIAIHIQNPHVNHQLFDWIITPEHDGISGPNIIPTTGAIHGLTSSVIASHINALQEKTSKTKQIIAILLGGPARHHQFDLAASQSLMDQITAKFDHTQYQRWWIPSRRTPDATIDLLRKNLKQDDYLGSSQNREDYLSALAHASYIIATEDSVSMISEASATGKPIYLASLPKTRHARRISSFHLKMKAMGITKTLDQPIEAWDYEPLHEGQRAAKILRDHGVIV